MEIENSLLNSSVETDSPLKEWVVNYVGNKMNPDNGNVTVEMTLDIFAEEFPEFVLALAEENFLRGYKQALQDVQSLAAEEQQNEQPTS
jgi:hypothetical protein